MIYHIPGFTAKSLSPTLSLVTCIKTGHLMQVAHDGDLLIALLIRYAGDEGMDGRYHYVPQSMAGQVFQVWKRLNGMLGRIPLIEVCTYCKENPGSHRWTLDGDVITICNDCAEIEGC